MTTARKQAAGIVDRRTLGFKFVVQGGVKGDDVCEYALARTFDEAATFAIDFLRKEIDTSDWTHYPAREVTDREDAIRAIGNAKGNANLRVDYGTPEVTPCYLEIVRRRVES